MPRPKNLKAYDVVTNRNVAYSSSMSTGRAPLHKALAGSQGVVIAVWYQQSEIFTGVYRPVERICIVAFNLGEADEWHANINQRALHFVRRPRRPNAQ
jgi:hypothetical protein